MLLSKYLPNVVPFTKFNIVASLDEWDAIKTNYGAFTIQRVDAPIGSLRAVSQTNGGKSDIPRILTNAQEANPDAVVLVLDTKTPSCSRYLYDGGFNILFAVDDCVAIEIVAKGFDAHELVRNKAVHERYILPWNEAIFAKNLADLMKISRGKYFVQPCQYTLQRNERVRFLVNSCRYNLATVEKSIPTEVQRISDSLISQLLDEIVITIIEQQKQIVQDGYRQFCVQGNFVNKTVQPWEFFTGKWI